MSTPDEYEKLYARIGEVASLWASLEQSLRALLHDLATLQNPIFSHPDDDSAFIVAITMAGHMDARQLIASAKVFAHWASADINGFYGKATRLLSNIDNDLRNQRNRYVHDQWYIMGDRIGRIQGGSIVKNEPSTGEPKYQYHRDTRYQNLEATGQLAKDIRAAILALDEMAQEVRDAALAKWPQVLSL